MSWTLKVGSREITGYEPAADRLNPSPPFRDLLAAGAAGAFARWDEMEFLFEFMFGASGRINRAKYWRSVLIYICAGLMAAVILATAAGIAAPLFIIMAVVVLIPWLLWGLSFTTERLHDRDKSAWWLLVFYVLPGALVQFENFARPAGTPGLVLRIVLTLAALALSIWGFVEIGCLRGTPGENFYGPDPLAQAKRRS